MFSFTIPDHEKLLVMGRQAESVLLLPALGVSLAIYIPIALLLRADLLFRFGWLLLTWTCIVLVYAIHKYFLWLVNVHLVTDRRIIRIAYKTLLKKEIHEMMLSDITGMKLVTNGVFGSLFGYGDLSLESGVAGSGVMLPNVHDAEKLKMAIWKARESLGKVEIAH